MTLWICSAARNEGKMAERVPRTMQGYDGNTGHTVPRRVAHPRPLWFCQVRVNWCIPVGRHWRIKWEEPSPDGPLQPFHLQIRPRSGNLLLIFWPRVARAGLMG